MKDERFSFLSQYYTLLVVSNRFKTVEAVCKPALASASYYLDSSQIRVQHTFRTDGISLSIILHEYP